MDAGENRIFKAHAPTLHASGGSGLPAFIEFVGDQTTVLCVVVSLLFCLALFLELRQFLQWLLGPGNKADAVMVSLPYSNYVEMARWALHAKKIRVREFKCAIGVRRRDPHIVI